MVRRQLLASAAALLVLAAIPAAWAQDVTAAFRDLATGGDFRVRVAAALVLGKSSSPGARPALEKALGDPHPAVRAAAAAALGALGDPAALAALRTAALVEATGSVKAQMQGTIRKLSGAAPLAPARARYLVALGRVDNRSGVSRSDLASVLKTSSRLRMGQVPGIEVLVEGTDPGVEGKSRKLPAFTVNVSLTQLVKAQGDDGVGYAARVECLIRKMPEQTLKGMMTGAARAFADARAVRGQDELAQLQTDAVSGAVESAMKGASPALEAALR